MFCQSYEHWDYGAGLPAQNRLSRAIRPGTMLGSRSLIQLAVSSCQFLHDLDESLGLSGSCFLSGCCHTRMRCHRAVTATDGSEWAGVWVRAVRHRAGQAVAGFTEGMYVNL
jgi:hypothetical protein